MPPQQQQPNPFATTIPVVLAPRAQMRQTPQVVVVQSREPQTRLNFPMMEQSHLNR